MAIYAGVVVVLARLALQLTDCWRTGAMPILHRAARWDVCGVCSGASGVRVHGSDTERATEERHGESTRARGKHT